MPHCKMAAVWLGLGTKATLLGQEKGHSLGEKKHVISRAAFSLKPGISQHPKLGAMLTALWDYTHSWHAEMLLKTVLT